MTEPEYTDVSNLTALRIASDTLGRVMLEDTPHHTVFIEARKQLKLIEIALAESTL